MNFIFMRNAVVAIVTICTFSSCLFGTYIDPGNVPVDRQKDNIYYIPSSSVIPELNKKNDINIGLNTGFATKSARTEIYAAYSPIKELGIFASYGGSKNRMTLETSEVSLALGYLKPISPLWHFEVYGGFDEGHILNHHYTGSSKVNTTRVFLQPDISVHNVKNTVSLSLVSRFTTAASSVHEITFNESGETFSASQLNIIEAHPNRIFFEPGLMFRFGWPDFLFNINYTSSAIVSGENFYRSTYFFSLGGVLRFNASKKVSKK